MGINVALEEIEALRGFDLGVIHEGFMIPKKEAEVATTGPDLE
jgi:hypothetical protein